MFYKYETHLHTSPASRCGKAGVRESVEFYKEMGYDGIFITNHFYINELTPEDTEQYATVIDLHFADYEQAKAIGDEIGIKVFVGVEITHGGTDFLVYGLDKAWYLSHPEILAMKKTEQLPYLMEAGALVIQAHPFREAGYIDHIRLFPRSVHGVEIINACRTEFENNMAAEYAKAYGLLFFAGSDNHVGSKMKTARGFMAGMCSKRPIESELDFVQAVLKEEMRPFSDRYETED